MSNYAFVAFLSLLERLPEINNSEEDFSNNFEDNVCVCVFNQKVLGLQNPLHLCINSLRKYGYCYFEDDNKIQAANGFRDDLYVERDVKNLSVIFQEPELYNNPVIELMLRALPHAHNVIHRFVLLYQVIETLMEIVTRQKIDEAIKKLQCNTIPHNDFLDNMKAIGREKERIREIFSICNLTADEFNCFKEPCKKLFGLANYEPDNMSDDAMVFYAFRNQMTHAFRNIHIYPEQVAETVQGFEKVVLTILQKYKTTGI